MKIRIGIQLGQWPNRDLSAAAITELIDFFESLDVDSLWVSDRIVSPALTLEPIAFLSFVAGRLDKMKLGTSTLVLPTRHPVVLAKELATLDFLSQGRLFPAIGLGGDESRDLQAVGIARKERAGRTDEAIALMRKLWSEANVTFAGKYFSVEDVTVMPRPWQERGPPLWIGGRSQAAMRRTGRLGDGWLVSSVAPDEVEAGIQSIRAHAAAANRRVPDDHYGVVLPFYFADDAEKALDLGGRAIRPRPDLPISEYSAFGAPDHVRAKIQTYIRAGASKFVMRPCGPFDGWREQIAILAREVIAPIQTPQ